MGQGRSRADLARGTASGLSASGSGGRERSETRAAGLARPGYASEVRTGWSLRCAAPIGTSVEASSRDWARVFMNAPDLVLTSSTSPDAPSAIFLLMIELAISGTDSTVLVTSRSAYSFLSAGASPDVAAQITAPTSSS